jgi:hypothetical protein
VLLAEWRSTRALSFVIGALLLVVSPTSAATIAALSSADLQAALTNAQPGDTITLTPGAIYTGNFTLPKKGGASFITLQTRGTGLPAAGTRISPAQAPGLAKLRSPNNLPALQTAEGAHHWRIVLIEFQANRGGAGDVITLGDGSRSQTALAQVPHDLFVDRCYIHGDPSVGQKRGIALNSASTTVTGSYISDIKAVGQDTQAINAWNGPGPFSITNNYLEAAGENILFGGTDPAIADLVPSDITIANNTVAKPPSWRSQSWQVKNLFELKNARRVTVESNTFEYNWLEAQPGFCILFTVRNQDGACPWCQVEEVVFQNNIVRHSGAGISILGYDDLHPSRQTRAITIRNNLFDDIDGEKWGGNGYFLLLLGGPRDITVDHNTVIQDHAYGILLAEGASVLGFTFTNNLIRHSLYGIMGANQSPGNDAIRAYLPASQITANVIADGDPSRYPPGNTFPTWAQFQAQFVSFATGDYRLVANSPWRNAGIDGASLGVAVVALPPGGVPAAPCLHCPNR